MKVNGVTVFVCLYDIETDQILLVKNKPKKTGKPGKWGLPGGGMEDKDNNDYLNAVQRELEEEAGLFREFSEFAFRTIDSRDTIYFENIIDRFEAGSIHQVVTFFALTKIPANKLQVSPNQTNDVSKAKWLPVHELHPMKREKEIYNSHYYRIMFFLKRFRKNSRSG